AGDARTDVIPAFGLRQRFDRRADRAKPRRELPAAAIDRRLVGARRLEPHECFDEGDRLVEVFFAVIEELSHIEKLAEACPRLSRARLMSIIGACCWGSRSRRC